MAHPTRLVSPACARLAWVALAALALHGCNCGPNALISEEEAQAQDAGRPPSELCHNDLDDDGDGLVDEDCTCLPGKTRSCYPADAGLGAGVCRAGVETCALFGELTGWGACSGAVAPSAEQCNGLDDDCDGRIDEDVAARPCSSACGSGQQVCTAGAWSACSAPQPTTEVCNNLDDDCDGRIDDGLVRPCSSACGTGQQLCASGAWGACSARQPGVEICNGLDDDCDTLVDEGCPVCIKSPGVSPWQIHYGAPAACWPTTFSQHGDPAEYAYASVPAENDSGWQTHSTPNISFDDPSTLCGVCNCMAGGDFTYFQTSLNVPSGYAVNSLLVRIADVDDGVRVTIYNATYPQGVVSTGSYAYLGGGSTSDLKAYIVTGHNRIVLTHVDDCCQIRRIANVSVTLNGTNLNPCP